MPEIPHSHGLDDFPPNTHEQFKETVPSCHQSLGLLRTLTDLVISLCLFEAYRNLQKGRFFVLFFTFVPA
jgi:hypothetical protein